MLEIQEIEETPYTRGRWRHRMFRHNAPFGEADVDVPRRKHGFVRMTGQNRLGDWEQTDMGLPRKRSHAFQRASGRVRLGDWERTDMGMPRKRSHHFQRASSRVRLGDWEQTDMGMPRKRSHAFQRASGRVRLGDWERTDMGMPRHRSHAFQRASGRVRLGEADVDVPRRKHGFVRMTGQNRLGELTIDPDLFDSHLDYSLLPRNVPCRPAQNYGPPCVKYSEINSLSDAQQYARRFFRSAVRLGLQSPDGSAIQLLFNASARLYYEADREAEAGHPLNPIIQKLGESDRNMVAALRIWNAKHPPAAFEKMETIPESLKEVLRPWVDVDRVNGDWLPDIGGKNGKNGDGLKIAGLPWWAVGLFAAAGVGMYVIGRRQEEEEAYDTYEPSMSGLSGQQVRFGRAAKSCGGHGLSAAQFRACMSRSLSGPS